MLHWCCTDAILLYEVGLKGGVPKNFLLHHSTHFWVPITKIYLFLGVKMDFLFLFDCDYLRHKEEIRCTLVNADSCDSRNTKMPVIKYVKPRSYNRCMTYLSQQYGRGLVLTKPLPYEYVMQRFYNRGKTKFNVRHFSVSAIARVCVYQSASYSFLMAQTVAIK